MARLTGKNALICGDARTLKITAPFDLTGYTVTFTVKAATALASDSDAGAIVQVSKSTHDGASDDPTNGITYLSLSEDDTRVTAGTYVADVQFDDGSADSPTSSKKFEVEFVYDVTKA